MTGHHNIFLGDYAGSDCSLGDSYKFEMRINQNMILHKNMTPQEQEWLVQFLASCDNSLGVDQTHLPIVLERTEK